MLQDIAREERRPARGNKAKAPVPAAKRPAADPSKLEQAGRELDAARRELASQLADIERRRAELDAEERTTRLDGEARVFELERARDREKRAYERAAARIK
jgi:hypothetical protein